MSNGSVPSPAGPGDAPPPDLVVFSHGKESGPAGSKIVQMSAVARALGADVLSVDYTAHRGQPNEDRRRVEQLRSATLPPHRRLVLVGSSMGSYVSAAASRTLRPAGLFLLAPAFERPGYDEAMPAPVASHVALVHGWSDDVIAPDTSIAYARRFDCALHLLPGDHRLQASIGLILPIFRAFLERCFGDPR